MSDLKTLKTSISKMEEDIKGLESRLLKATTLKESYEQTLLDVYKIKPDEVDIKLKAMSEEKDIMQEKIETKVTEMSGYIAKLKVALNE